MKKKNGELTVVNQNAVVVNGNGDMVAGFYNGDYQELLKEIENQYINISGNLGLLSPEQKQQIIDNVAGNKLARNINQDYNLSPINLDTEIEKFIDMQVSEVTQYAYRSYIKLFQEYCDNNRLDFLKVTHDNIKGYLSFFKRNKYASRTVRVRIAGLSSFFKQLNLNYPDTIKVNPFLGHKLPKVEDRFPKDYVTKNDFKVLCADLKRIKRYDLICIVELLYKYGWRIGIYNKMKINEDRSWQSVSKGDIKKGKLTKTELEKMIDSGVFILNDGVLKLQKEYTMKTVGSKIKEITGRLYRDKKVTCAFSAHDLRRARIIELSKKYGADKFLKVSAMFHKSVATTELYTRGVLDR